MLLKKLFNITDPEYLNGLAKAGSIGLHLVSGVVVGTAAGYFLDKWLDTGPWLLLLFMVFGIVAGFKNVYTDTKRLAAADAAEQKKAQRVDAEKPDVEKTAAKNGNGPT